MPNDESILDAARSIRPFLSELASPEKANELDRQLAESLAEASGGQSVSNKIVKNLAASPGTRKWLEEFLKDGKPPSAPERAFAPPLGDPAPVFAAKYVCPHGDYTWYQMAAGKPVPLCPTHGVALAAAP